MSEHRSLTTQTGARRTQRSQIVRLISTMVLVTSLGLPAVATANDPASASAMSLAVFEGEVIDLAEGWGDAQACVVWETAAMSECFKTAAEMDARVAEVDARRTQRSARGTRSSYCSGSLRLYDGTYYTGAVLNFRLRGQWSNLSQFGFSNRTSSFKVGPCSARFADYSNGGGSSYPSWAIQAWDTGSTMLSGWNNRVSSVYIF